MGTLKIDLDPALKHLEIFTKKNVKSKLLGKYRSVFKGRGLEFESYKEYTENDDASQIDWKSSKRANKLLVKQFIEERNLNAFFLIDGSASMVYGTTRKLKIEYALEVSSALFYAIINSDDSAGFGVFNEKVTALHKPQRGLKQFYVFRKAIINDKLYGGKGKFDSALRYLHEYMKGVDILFLVSDFINLEGDWKHYLKMLAQRMDIIAINVRDPADRDIPTSDFNIIFQSPFGDDQQIVQPNAIKKKYKAFVAAEEKKLKDDLRKMGIDLINLQTDKPFITDLHKYFIGRMTRYR